MILFYWFCDIIDILADITDVIDITMLLIKNLTVTDKSGFVYILTLIIYH